MQKLATASLVLSSAVATKATTQSDPFVARAQSDALPVDRLAASFRGGDALVLGGAPSLGDFLVSYYHLNKDPPALGPDAGIGADGTADFPLNLALVS